MKPLTVLLSRLLSISALVVLCQAVIHCAGEGGGTSGTGLLRVEGVVQNSTGFGLADVIVTDLATGESATTDADGKFELEVDVAAILTFERRKSSAQLDLSTVVPGGAESVAIVFAFDEQREIVDVEEVVVKKRRPTPTATPRAGPTSTPRAPTPTATPLPPGVTPTATPQGVDPTPTATAAVEPTVTPTHTPTAAPFPTGPSYQKGDMNCNGILDFGDTNGMRLAMQDPEGYAQQYPGCDIDLGDMNSDGVIDDTDLILLTDALGSS